MYGQVLQNCVKNLDQWWGIRDSYGDSRQWNWSNPCPKGRFLDAMASTSATTTCDHEGDRRYDIQSWSIQPSYCCNWWTSQYSFGVAMMQATKMTLGRAFIKYKILRIEINCRLVVLKVVMQSLSWKHLKPETPCVWWLAPRTTMTERSKDVPTCKVAKVAKDKTIPPRSDASVMVCTDQAGSLMVEGMPSMSVYYHQKVVNVVVETQINQPSNVMVVNMSIKPATFPNNMKVSLLKEAPSTILPVHDKLAVGFFTAMPVYKNMQNDKGLFAQQQQGTINKKENENRHWSN